MRCPPASAAAADDGRTPIAVLHFVDRSAQDEWGWLGKGLADMLITDLSVSGSIVIVDRDRMAAAVAETGLAESGLADVTNAGKAGQVCKVAHVVFGSFVHQRGRLVIEAHVADVDSGKLLQVQHVEGSPDELFQLEKQLARQLLEGLHAPLSAADLAKLERLPTRSLPAVEHYSRSLSHFDRGDWHAALLACRLAQRSDPGFLKAAIRVAKLYREVGEPEHALVEYRRLTDADADNSLPEIVYLELG
jgi:TolB-like protein